jgi:hypothetical protein
MRGPEVLALAAMRTTNFALVKLIRYWRNQGLILVSKFDNV